MLRGQFLALAAVLVTSFVTFQIGCANGENRHITIPTGPNSKQPQASAQVAAVNQAATNLKNNGYTEVDPSQLQTKSTNDVNNILSTTSKMSDGTNVTLKDLDAGDYGLIEVAVQLTASQAQANGQSVSSFTGVADILFNNSQSPAFAYDNAPQQNRVFLLPAVVSLNIGTDGKPTVRTNGLDVQVLSTAVTQAARPTRAAVNGQQPAQPQQQPRQNQAPRVFYLYGAQRSNTEALANILNSDVSTNSSGTKFYSTDNGKQSATLRKYNDYITIEATVQNDKSSTDYTSVVMVLKKDAPTPQPQATSPTKPANNPSNSSGTASPATQPATTPGDDDIG